MDNKNSKTEAGATKPSTSIAKMSDMFQQMQEGFRGLGFEACRLTEMLDGSQAAAAREREWIENEQRKLESDHRVVAAQYDAAVEQEHINALVKADLDKTRAELEEREARLRQLEEEYDLKVRLTKREGIRFGGRKSSAPPVPPLPFLGESEGASGSKGKGAVLPEHISTAPITPPQKLAPSFPFAAEDNILPGLAAASLPGGMASSTTAEHNFARPYAYYGPTANSPTPTRAPRRRRNTSIESVYESAQEEVGDEKGEAGGSMGKKEGGQRVPSIRRVSKTENLRGESA